MYFSANRIQEIIYKASQSFRKLNKTTRSPQKHRRSDRYFLKEKPIADLTFFLIRMPRIGGRDWNRKRLYPALRNKLEIEKSFRDTWLKWFTRAVQRCQEPLCRNLSERETYMMQKKATCYQYNQFGISNLNYRFLQWGDYAHGYRGHPGSGNWVNMINLSNITWYQMIRNGHFLCHRCHVRGLGTDPYMSKGGYEYRWKKCMDRDFGHYTRP